MHALAIDDVLSLCRQAEHLPPSRRRVLFAEARIRLQQRAGLLEDERTRAFRFELERLERESEAAA